MALRTSYSCRNHPSHWLSLAPVHLPVWDLPECVSDMRTLSGGSSLSLLESFLQKTLGTVIVSVLGLDSCFCVPGYCYRTCTHAGDGEIRRTAVLVDEQNQLLIPKHAFECLLPCHSQQSYLLTCTCYFKTFFSLAIVLGRMEMGMILWFPVGPVSLTITTSFDALSSAVVLAFSGCYNDVAQVEKVSGCVASWRGSLGCFSALPSVELYGGEMGGGSMRAGVYR